MKRYESDCPSCDLRGECTVSRLLETAGVACRSSILRLGPPEAAAREFSDLNDLFITVRGGLLATGFYQEEGFFLNEITGRGGVAGSAALLRDAPAADYILPVGSVELCLVDKSLVRRACARSREASAEVAALIFNHSGGILRQAWVLSGGSIRKRLTRLLSVILLWDNPADAGGRPVIEASHAFLANAVNAQRHNVTDALNDMRGDGVIGMGRRSIFVNPSFFELEEHRSNPWLKGGKRVTIRGGNVDMFE